MCARASSKSQRSDADIWRDPWGIPPHQGANAQQRLSRRSASPMRATVFWQMEALLRRGTGRYADGRVQGGGATATFWRVRSTTTGASRGDFDVLGAGARAMLESYAPRRQRLHRDGAIGRSNIK